MTRPSTRRHRPPGAVSEPFECGRALGQACAYSAMRSTVGLIRKQLLGDAELLIPYLRRRLAALAALGPLDPIVLPDPSARAAAVPAPMYAVERRPYLLFTRRTAH